ncbi:MAG: hypothetical protein JSV00_02310 [bacterium]|nr:MAG: hypothetical protein JSV00_02310 [bacterium]
MVDTGRILRGRTYGYPGSGPDYMRQAARFGVMAFSVMGLIFALTVLVDRVVLGRQTVGLVHLAMLITLGVAACAFAALMARSLARFRIHLEGGGMVVSQSGGERYIPLGGIRKVERVRITGWFPLHPDMKSRAETSRHMVRITLDKGRPVTFKGGLEGEEELIEALGGDAFPEGESGHEVR